jgi:hypothetical protein
MVLALCSFKVQDGLCSKTTFCRNRQPCSDQTRLNCVSEVLIISAFSPVLIPGEHRVKRCVSKDGRKTWCKLPSFETQAFALRGEGLLLRMRTESLATIGFMQSIH